VSVLGYITILFITAFLLLLMSYFMQQRSNEEVISGLKESVSAMQSLENLQAEKDELAAQVKSLQEQNALLKDTSQKQSDTLSTTADALSLKEKEVQATEWLRQIQTLYAMDYYKAARKLITEFQKTELPSFLPTESAVPDKASPAEDYAKILDALY
jgi:cell division protein FtsB